MADSLPQSVTCAPPRAQRTEVRLREIWVHVSRICEHLDYLVTNLGGKRELTLDPPLSK